MLARLRLILVAGGAVLGFIGFEEYRVSQGTGGGPQQVTLQALEADGVPENPHLELGSHWALHWASVYEYRQGRFETDEPDDATEVNHTYYPIISDEHAYIRALGELEERYGTLGDAPDEEFPELRGDIAVLVKTRKFKTVGDIPTGLDRVDSLTGLVINQISGLDGEEVDLVRESFPDIDIARLAILEQDREPASPARSLGMLGGGALLVLGGAGWWLVARRSG